MKSRIIYLVIFLFALATVKGQWTQITPDTSGVFRAVKFKNDTDGLILGNDGIVLKSTDKGETWEHLPNDLNADLIDFQFLNDTLIYAYGSNRVYASTDFGISWTEQLILPNKASTAYFLDINTGFALGTTNGLLRTFDGGVTWDSIWEHSGQDVLFSSQNDIDFVNDSIGFACGYAYKEKQFIWGNILRTADRGNTWAMVFESPSIYQITDLIEIQVVMDSSIIAIEDDFTLIKSNDFGENWSILTINKPDPEKWSGMTVSSMFSLNYDTILVGSEVTVWITKSGGDQKRKILRTTNGGQDWIVQFLDDVNSNCCGIPLLSSIYFLNDTLGFATGNNLILRTTNTGGDIHIRDTLIIGSVEDFSGDQSNISIFPNPTKDYLTVEIDNDDYNTLDIYNVSGSKKSNIRLNHINTINLTAYSSGLYILRFTGKKICYRRIIKTSR